MESGQGLKILYHHRTQGRGAEGVHITSIVKALEAMGHQVTVLSPPGVDPLSNAGNAPVDKSEVKTSGISSLWKFISKNLPNFVFELIEMVYNIPAMRNLEKALKAEKYDIIYERYAFFMIAGAVKAKKYSIPLVLEANEVSGIKDRARKQTFKKICDKFERFLFKRTTSIHTVSSYLKSMIEAQGVASEKVEVTPNAIDPEKFSGEKNFGDLKSKLDIPESNTVIGFAGWFDNWDRLDLLMESFNRLKQQRADISLVLIGDGAVLDGVREQIKQYGLEKDVVLTGAVERTQIHQYLSLLDIAVFTHSNEFGSPVVMFEFMGLKIPVVAPTLMPITDVMADEKTALLFETLDMPAMESQLLKLIDDSTLRQKLADNAFQQLMEKHTWHANALEIIHTAGLK